MVENHARCLNDYSLDLSAGLPPSQDCERSGLLAEVTGLLPRRLRLAFSLLQELEHALLRLIGKRERGHCDRLAGRQRLAVGGFLIGVGQRQVG